MSEDATVLPGPVGRSNATQDRGPLTRPIIVKAALDLLDEVGFDKLTTRRIGDQLGVEGPALYRHFPSKAALLDHMAAALLLPVIRQPRADEQWDEWLRATARASFAAVMSHRDGARLIAASLPIEPLDLISKPLQDAGFTHDRAVFASKFITRLMVGWQLHEESERQRDDRSPEDYNRCEAFEFALDVMIEGLRLKLNQDSSADA
ncbi:TetR family transcriptional regulator [Aurantiacibacter xanthus]|uniref:TetR family transcriptional regulator n=1 Tax=Aurantiacibacter xanthus TaxID=1784712 RepID=A0A3A1P5P4_9SPHN|nr:TetR family transcriptional regulator [Aurantiacibacter xanthus]RIV82622.1 TetR family transcriptional regulator [Aurantiacibacter xanthus]